MKFTATINDIRFTAVALPQNGTLQSALLVEPNDRDPFIVLREDLYYLSSLLPDEPGNAVDEIMNENECDHITDPAVIASTQPYYGYRVNLVNPDGANETLDGFFDKDRAFAEAERNEEIHGKGKIEVEVVARPDDSTILTYQRDEDGDWTLEWVESFYPEIYPL